MTFEKRRLTTARTAVAAVFFLSGLVFANWVPRIPDIKNELGLSNFELGLCLLGPAMGAVIAMAVSGKIIARVGSAPLTKLGALLLPLSLLAIAVAENAWQFGLALGVFGLLNGALDVAMNAHGVAVEREYRRPILSSFHAFYSLGALVGAAVAGVITANNVDVDVHMAWATAGCLLLAIVSIPGLLPGGVDSEHHVESDTDEADSGRSWTPAVFVLGIMGFCCFLGEGAIGDWSAVYLREELGAEPGFASAGLIAFSITMTIGRFLGDRITMWLGPVRLARTGGAIAAIGLGGGVLSQNAYVALGGFLLFGAGVSCLVPILFSAAGNLTGVSRAKSLAHFSMLSYFGLFIGPPLIGAVATLTTLEFAVALPALFITSFLFGAPWVKSASGGTSDFLDPVQH